MRRNCLMVSALLAGIRPSVRMQRTRLLPQLLTQTGVPNIAANPARLPLEWWPTSRRYGGSLHVGAVARFTVGIGGPLRVGIPGPLPSEFALNSPYRLFRPTVRIGRSGAPTAPFPQVSPPHTMEGRIIGRAPAGRLVSGVMIARNGLARAQALGHAHQVRQRFRLHLAHQIAAVDLDRDLAEFQAPGDLLVHQAGGDEAEHIPFARRETVEAVSQA